MVEWSPFIPTGEDGADYRFLVEEECLSVMRCRGRVSMDVNSLRLSPRHVALANDNRVTSLSLNLIAESRKNALRLLPECEHIRSLHIIVGALSHTDLTVLEELRDRLRALSILTYSTVDLSVIATLTRLRDFSLSHSIHVPCLPLELGHLKLQECRVWLRPEYLSVLQCRTLKTLTIDRSNYVKQLDLTRLSRLSQLTIEGAAGLATMSLHPKCKLRAIKLGECYKLQIDPKRLFRDVRHLALVGRSRVSLTDLPHAKHMTSLVLNQVPVKWRFNALKKCKKLKAVDLFTGLRKKDPANERIVRQINKAGGYGPVLAPRLLPGKEAD